MAIDRDIATFDLECIAYKVCRDEGWTLEQVDRVEIQYRAFLQAIRDGGPGFSAAPTGPIDTFWHHHILDTQKYFQDCERMFGRYIHHFPYSGIFDGEDEAKQSERRRATTARLRNILGETQTSESTP